MTELDDQQKAILDFERAWDHCSSLGRKEAAIRETFDLSATTYNLRRNALLRHPAAEAYAPQLVHRLLRLQGARARQRSAQRLAVVSHEVLDASDVSGT